MMARRPFLCALAACLAAGCSGEEPRSGQSDAAATASPATAPGTAPASPVAAATATPPAEPAPAIPSGLRVTGTEPFWSAEIEGRDLLYKTPEFPGGTRVAVTRRVVGRNVEFSGVLGGRPLMLRIASGPCSDGMSDKIYPLTAEREIGPDIQRGCARPD